MCSGRCAKGLGIALIPLSLCCITANILLYFPNGETIYAEQDYLTSFVWFFTGIVGGGVVMFLPAAAFITAGDCDKDSPGRRSCVMFGSVVAALIGVAGAAYCFIVSAVALSEGPYCQTPAGWVYPFEDGGGRYLTEPDSWSICLSPTHVVEWNITLFSILLILSGLEAIICIIQAINGLMSCLCGPCCRDNYSMDA